MRIDIMKRLNTYKANRYINLKYLSSSSVKKLTLEKKRKYALKCKFIEYVVKDTCKFDVNLLNML